jgi:hypothetical protein
VSKPQRQIASIYRESAAARIFYIYERPEYYLTFAAVALVDALVEFDSSFFFSRHRFPSSDETWRRERKKK